MLLFPFPPFTMDADLVSFDAALVDAGRREGSECAITHLRSRTYGTHTGERPYARLRALFHRAAASIIGRSSGAGISIGDRDRQYGVESCLASTPTLLDTVGRPEWRPVAPR